MNSIDALILGLTSATTLLLITRQTRVKSLVPLLIGFVLFLSTLQLLLDDFYWQHAPTYLLLFVVSIATIALRKTTRSRYKRLLQVTLTVLLLVSIAPWALFPAIPVLTKPQGHYVVGTRIFRWIDPNRAEEITKDSTDKRNVIVQTWYPSEVTANNARSGYIDGMEQLPDILGRMPGFFAKQYNQIDTYGLLNAPLNKVRRQWAVVILLTGYGGTRAVYNSLAVGLASRGYVVLALDHPYEAIITELANGKVVTIVENFPEKNPDRIRFMEGRMKIRVADIKFVVSQVHKQKSLSEPLFLALDLNRIVVAGHSFGGAAGAVAMANDSRIKAAVNLDGTLYGDLPVTDGPRHFLLLESNKQDADRYVRYEAGTQRLFRQFKGGYRYELTGADHYSFTDVPLFLTPLARYLTGNLFDFGQLTTNTHTASIEIMDAFFGHALYGKAFDANRILVQYQKIKQKPVDP